MDHGIVFLKEMINNNNEMYREEGALMGWNLFVFQSNVIIQYIDWDGRDDCINYHIPNVNEFMDKLKVKYEEDGGDEEYESITNWILNIHLVKELAIEIE